MASDEEEELLREEIATLRAEIQHWKDAYDDVMASLAKQELALRQEIRDAEIKAEDALADNARMREVIAVTLSALHVQHCPCSICGLLRATLGGRDDE